MEKWIDVFPGIVRRNLSNGEIQYTKLLKCVKNRSGVYKSVDVFSRDAET